MDLNIACLIVAILALAFEGTLFLCLPLYRSYVMDQTLLAIARHYGGVFLFMLLHTVIMTYVGWAWAAIMGVFLIIWIFRVRAVARMTSNQWSDVLPPQ